MDGDLAEAFIAGFGGGLIAGCGFVALCWWLNEWGKRP